MAPAPPVQALSIPAPPVQALSIPALSVPVSSGPAPLIQTPTAEEVFPAQVPPVQVLSASTPLAAKKPSRKQHEKHLEQVHIASPTDICFPVDKCTDNDANSRLS